MNWKSFFIGLSAGFLGGYTVKILFEQAETLSAEKVLDNVKEIFKQDGPISGSWIHMKAEPFQKNDLTYEIYKGGISRNINGLTRQYEFIADAKTGTILESYVL